MMSSSSTTDNNNNLTWHNGSVSPQDRLQLLKQTKGAVLWFTGLSGSGKSTIAVALEEALVKRRQALAYRLDGDNIRCGLCAGLGFSSEDRSENLRRIAHVAQLFGDMGCLVAAAFVSPLREQRQMVKDIVGTTKFVEIHVQVPLSVAESRDPKGLYVKARKGEIPNFTGISAPYEEPESPDLRLDTSQSSVDECVEEVLQYLEEQGILGPTAT